MASVATLTIDLIGNSAKLNTELRKATKGTEDWARKTRSSVNAIGNVLAGVGVAGAAGLTAIYLEAAKTGDAVAKLSDRIGEAPERLMGLQRAAELTGAGTEKLNSSMLKMVKNLGDARNGTGEAALYLEKMGLSTEAFFSLSPADQFGVIADKVSGMATQQEKAAVAAKIFGEEGLALVNTLELGSAGLSAVQQEAERLGLTMSRVDLAKLEAANDSFYTAKEITAGFGRQLAIQVAPLLDAVSQGFINSAKEAGGFGYVARNVVQVTANGIGIMADGVHGIRLLYTGLKVVVAELVDVSLQSFSALDRGVTALLNKIPGVEAKQSEFLKNFAESTASVAEQLRTELSEMTMGKIPSEKIKEWMEDAYKKADEAAKKVAEKSAINIPVGLSGGDSAVGIADQKAKKQAEDNAREVAAQREKFSQIHEAALEADKKVIDLENYRAQRKRDQLQREYEALKSSGALTVELEAEFQTAKEEQEITHQARLKAIRDAAIEEERKKKEEGYANLIDLAETYNNAKGLSANKYTAVALRGLKILASAEKREAVKTVLRDGVVAIQKAASSAPFPANVPAVVWAGAQAAANFASVSGIAHGGLDNVPKEATYLLDEGERVLSPGQNKEIMNFVRSGGRNGITKIEVINNISGVQMSASAEQDGETMRLILTAVDNKLRKDLNDGRGVWREAKERFGLSTKGAI